MPIRFLVRQVVTAKERASLGGFSALTFCLTMTFCMSLFSAGCSKKSMGPISGDTLVGRWRAVTKGDADEGNAIRDARSPTGETVAFRFEFRADCSFEESAEMTGGLAEVAMPRLLGKHVVRGTWTVVEVEGDTLIIELPDPKLKEGGFPNPRLKI